MPWAKEKLIKTYEESIKKIKWFSPLIESLGAACVKTRGEVDGIVDETLSDLGKVRQFSVK